MGTLECFCLRVKNLPSGLSTASITSLLSHYGATRVHVFQRQNIASSGREPGGKVSNKMQKAIAIFPSHETWKNAQKHLQSLEFAGHHPQVEVMDEGSTNTLSETRTKNSGNLPRQPHLSGVLLPPPPLAVHNPRYAPSMLAPYLGLNYASPPHLEYQVSQS